MTIPPMMTVRNVQPVVTMMMMMAWNIIYYYSEYSSDDDVCVWPYGGIGNGNYYWKVKTISLFPKTAANVK